MKKITLSLLLLASMTSFAQVTLIDPTQDGGFEVGTTFASNGWTEVGPAANLNRRWYCGTGQTGFTGTRGAFIGNDVTTVGTNNTARTIHLYKSITIPTGATNIILTFDYKQAVSDFSASTYYDYVTVSTGTGIPVNNAVLSGGTTHFGPFPNVDVPAFATQTVTLPNSLAGTTTNLVFTFITDNVAPKGYGAIDNISLVYTAPLSIQDFDKNKVIFYPNPVKNNLNLSYNETIESIEIFNILGQTVLTQNINKNDAEIDLSSLSNGNYSVKIKTVTTTQNIKIIKE